MCAVETMTDPGVDTARVGWCYGPRPSEPRLRSGDDVGRPGFMVAPDGNMAPVRRVTGWDTVFPLKRSEGHYLPTVDRIVRVAQETLEA